MTWQSGPIPFITLNTQTEGVSVTHGRHRLTRYVVSCIRGDSGFFTCTFNLTSQLCDCHSYFIFRMSQVKILTNGPAAQIEIVMFLLSSCK
jgi:hypothetical protein